MAYINPVVEGARILARQVSESATASGSLTSEPATTSFGSPPSATEPSSNGSPGGNSGSGGGGGGGGGGGSNPLLFFVALGFGVVFTNLWIIVGVKYCFRYNARSRAQQRHAEDGDPITMENVPRPHRRRREKKLISIDEVNEKFPMLKYKTWVASRAHQGLPTRGGVTAPVTRANSLVEADGVIPDLAAKEQLPEAERTPSDGAMTQAVKPEEGASSPTVEHRESVDDQASATDGAPLDKDTTRNSHDEDDEDDEHINAALPPECMGTSGDTCAICIDTLEDDDDVRGLSCGHAFHAVCLDPWLTSRRACCPLCKADYYVPKPRLAAGELGDGTTGVIRVTIPGDPRTNRMSLPSRPRHAFLLWRAENRPATPRRPGPGRDDHQDISQSNRREGPEESQHTRTYDDTGFLGLFRRHGRFPTSPQAPAPAPSPTRVHAGTSEHEARGGLFSNLGSALTGLRNLSQNRPPQPAPMESTTTHALSPSNLEAGVRPSVR